MTRNDDFIRQIESYLDEFEGSTVLPPSVRQAVRAELPKISQTGFVRGPVRYLNMFLSKTAPLVLAAAAAALVLGVGAFLASRPNVGGPNEPSLNAAPSASAQASADASAEACASTNVVQGSPGIQVNWCAYGPGEPGELAFTMDGPSEWISFWLPDVRTLSFRPEGGGAITFVFHPGQSAPEVAADVTGRPGYVIENRGEATIGGEPSEVFDVSLEQGTSAADAQPLFTDTQSSWPIQDGVSSRVWLVQLGADTLMVVTGEQLGEAVGEALTTIVWRD